MGACPIHSALEGLRLRTIAPICGLVFLFLATSTYGFLPSTSTTWYFLWLSLLFYNTSCVLLSNRVGYSAQGFGAKFASLIILTTILKFLLPFLYSTFQQWNYFFSFTSLLAITLLSKAVPWYIQLRKNVDTKALGEKFGDRFRPSFYFGATAHVRFTPIFHKFKYPLMYFGFPVEFEGTINALVSVRGVNQGPEKSYWGKGQQLWSFFEVDPTRYFNPDLPFSQKLDSVFQANSIDKSLYDIFFVTTPSFLGYCFNPVSYWYLYSKATGELQIVVLEVNNTFGEKHVYIMHHDNPKNPKTRQGFAWCGALDKHFHISPFNHRSGTYQIHIGDPLDTLNDQLLFNIHMVVVHRDGSKIMAAGVRSTQPGMDVVNANWKDILYTIVSWGFNQWMAIPRTMFEAWRTFKKGTVVYTRPEVLQGSGGRNPSEGEKDMTKIWLQYFEDRVQKYPHPLAVSIVMPQPHASRIPEIVTLQNFTEPALPSANIESCDATKSPVSLTTNQQSLHLTIQVNNPRFFRRFFALQDPKQAVHLDIISEPYERHSAHINNLELFLDVLLKSRPSEIGEYWRLQPQHSLRWRVLSVYRRLFSANVMHSRTIEMMTEGQCDTQQMDRKAEVAKNETLDPLLPHGSMRFNTLDYYISTLDFSTISKYRRLSLEAYLVDTIASGDVELFVSMLGIWKGFLYMARIIVMIWLGVFLGGEFSTGKALAEGDSWSRVTMAALFGIVNLGWVFETLVGYF